MFEQRVLRSSAFWLVVAIAFFVQTALAAIIIRLTTRWLPHSYAYSTGLTAAVFNLFTLVFLLSALASRRRTGSRSCQTVFCTVAITFTLVSVVLSIYVLAWMLAEKAAGTRGLASAGVACWVVGLMCQTAFYSYLMWPHKQQTETVPAIEVSTDRPSPARSAKRAISVHLASLKPPPSPFLRSISEPYSPTYMYSPSYSGFSTPRSSLRESFYQAVRPMTSKTRLIRHSFVSGDARSFRSGRPHSMETTRQDDGWETWDTSAVEEVVEEEPESPVQQRVLRSRLEPIPGSRPASPAKPLDGPFREPLAPEDTPLPDSPMQPPTNETSSLYERPFSPLRRPSSNQSHIHPLFRPESPLPPLVSPGTVITASPHAGQIVSPEHALAGRTLHSSQSFRSITGSPLLSPPASRSGSIKSFRMQLPPADPMPTSPLAESTTQLGG